MVNVFSWVFFKPPHDWQQSRQEPVGEHLTGVLRLSSTLSVDEALKKMLEAGRGSLIVMM